MRESDIAPGEAWIIETLRSVHNLHGWAAQRFERDASMRGVIRVTLVDRYGREFRYRVFVIPEETAIKFST